MAEFALVTSSRGPLSEIGKALAQAKEESTDASTLKKQRQMAAKFLFSQIPGVSKPAERAAPKSILGIVSFCVVSISSHFIKQAAIKELAKSDELMDFVGRLVEISGNNSVTGFKGGQEGSPPPEKPFSPFARSNNKPSSIEHNPSDHSLNRFSEKPGSVKPPIDYGMAPAAEFTKCPFSIDEELKELDRISAEMTANANKLKVVDRGDKPLDITENKLPQPEEDKNKLSDEIEDVLVDYDEIPDESDLDKELEDELLNFDGLPDELDITHEIEDKALNPENNEDELNLLDKAKKEKTETDLMTRLLNL